MIITQTSIRDFLRRKKLAQGKDNNWWDEMMPIFEQLCTEYLNIESADEVPGNLITPTKFHIIEYKDIEKYIETKGLVFVLKQFEGNEIVLKCHIEDCLKRNNIRSLSYSDRYHPQIKLSTEESEMISKEFHFNPITYKNNSLEFSLLLSNMNGTVTEHITQYNIVKTYATSKFRLNSIINELKRKKYIKNCQIAHKKIIIDNKNMYYLNNEIIENVVTEFEEVFL